MKFWNLTVFAAMALSPLLAAENGLVGVYFDNTRLLGTPVFTTVLPKLDFEIGGSPAPGVPQDYSARWSGEVLPPATGSYEIAVKVDDGVRVWIAEKLVIDQWEGNAPTVFTGSVNLTAGVRAPIVVEFFDDHFGGVLHLSWRPPGADLVIIPTSALFPTNPFIPNAQAALPTAPTSGLRLPSVIRSATSPAYLDIDRAAGSTVSAVSLFGSVTTTPINRVQTGLNVPLAWILPNLVLVQGGGQAYFRIAQWSPTVVAGDSEHVIRVGDALLLRARRSGSLSVDPECGSGALVPVLAGIPVSRTFNAAGNFVVRNLDRAGEEIGRIRVTVVGNPLPAEPTAIEIGHPRRYDLTSQPNPALIAVVGNDPALLAVPHYEFGAAATGDANGIRILAQPLARGDLKLVARVKSTGALLGLRTVDEYTIVSDFADGFLYTRDEEGFGHSRIGFTMEPVIPYSSIRLDVYVPNFTIEGASTVTVPASELDDAGHWDAEIVINPGYPLTCHRITVIAP